LVDVAVTRQRHVGSRAIWKTDELAELFCAFAEADAIGLSAIAGQLDPVGREQPHGVRVRIGRAGDPDCITVLAPIAPGLINPISVSEVSRLEPGESVAVRSDGGTIAVDGERHLPVQAGEPATVELSLNGPRCVDVAAVMRLAASSRLLSGRQSAAGIPGLVVR
jgi:hypothetical protein